MDASQQFAQLITDNSIHRAEKEVFRRARQLTRKIKSNTKDMDAIEAYSYFSTILQTLDSELRKWADRFSPEQWLWYLRRVPEPVLRGYLPSTFVYDISVAEVYSAYSKSKFPSKHNYENGLSFPITERIVNHVLKFCRMVRQVSRVHANLRYSGKGVGFRFMDPEDFLPHPDVPKDIEEAINLFDQRAEIQSANFGRAGTIVTENVEIWNPTSNQVLIVSRLAKPQILPNPWEIIRNQAPTQMRLTRFSPIFVALDKLADLSNKSGVSSLRWLSRDVLSLIALQRQMIYLMAKSEATHLNVPLVGYSVHSYSNLCIDEQNIYGQMLADLEKDFPNGQFPQSMKEALDHVALLGGQTHPLKHGPVIRKSGDIIFIDWYSMTQQLNFLLEFPNIQGAVANERAEHFELSVQSVINKSKWRPNSKLLELRGRTLKYTDNNREISLTDIDAIGERSDTLLIVSCKANVYSAEYDIGDHRAVRNQASNLQTYVAEWEDKKHLLLAHMIGNNYDFSSYRKIVAIVCTPRPVYVPIGQATTYETEGLRKAVSAAEFAQWLE
jgi:hypothetical protein